MKQNKYWTPVAVYLLQSFILFLSSFAIVNSAFATSVGHVSAATMITNFAASIPQLMRLTTAVAYVLGMYMVIHGVMQLKKYGDQRTQMSGEVSFKGPMLSITVGAALLYLPTSLQSSFTTFWTNPAPYAYQTDDAGPFKEFINACFMIVQLVGTIYFIKGLTMLAHTQSNQQNSFSRALTHIIGGVFCIDLYDFLNMIFTTLGLGEM